MRIEKINERAFNINFLFFWNGLIWFIVPVKWWRDVNVTWGRLTDSYENLWIFSGISFKYSVCCLRVVRKVTAALIMISYHGWKHCYHKYHQHQHFSKLFSLKHLWGCLNFTSSPGLCGPLNPQANNPKLSYQLMSWALTIRIGLLLPHNINYGWGQNGMNTISVWAYAYAKP